ncbi:MAG: 6-carboxytetrahydropterin synthase QueD [Bradymonadales bacterium]|nr:6-carboxytetrahydropterin synthase QueD [Bradymonadales bacterium]
MIVTLTKTLAFEAAHRLPNLPDGHKCRDLHGHAFHIDLAVSGEVDPRSGLLMDYAEIARVAEPVRKRLDHKYLNDIEGLENPTSEMLSVWIWERLKPVLPQLVAVTVRESSTASCTYTGPTD